MKYSRKERIYLRILLNLFKWERKGKEIFPV